MNDSVHCYYNNEHGYITYIEIISEGVQSKQFIIMIIYLCGLILNTLYYWAVKFIDLSSDRLLLDSFWWHAKSSLHVKKGEQKCGRYLTFFYTMHYRNSNFYATQQIYCTPKVYLVYYTV
jgi:hypothetical protein